MGFTSATDFNKLLPPYLTRGEKNLLRTSLEQFRDNSDKGDKKYTHFFLSNNLNEQFLQGDLIKEIRIADWNSAKKSFSKVYLTSFLLSNSCDVNPENSPDIPKEPLFAPVLDLPGFINDLKDNFPDEKVEQITTSIRNQNYSNIFYLPPNPWDNVEYIVWLDKIFTFPKEELYSYLPNIQEERVASLDLFGLYLFLIKLSYHLCRIPESNDRPAEKSGWDVRLAQIKKRIRTLFGNEWSFI